MRALEGGVFHDARVGVRAVLAKAFDVGVLIALIQHYAPLAAA
jgi:hypothetical protein